MLTEQGIWMQFNRAVRKDRRLSKMYDVTRVFGIPYSTVQRYDLVVKDHANVFRRRKVDWVVQDRKVDDPLGVA